MHRRYSPIFRDIRRMKSRHSTTWADDGHIGRGRRIQIPVREYRSRLDFHDGGISGCDMPMKSARAGYLRGSMGTFAASPADDREIWWQVSPDWLRSDARVEMRNKRDRRDRARPSRPSSHEVDYAQALPRITAGEGECYPDRVEWDRAGCRPAPSSPRHART